MFTDIGTTELLARIYGLYMLAGGIGLLIDPKAYSGVMQEFRDNGALGYLAGIMAFLAGAVTLALHDSWDGWPAILITLIGWASLIEGLLMLAFRRGFFAAISWIPTEGMVLRVFGAGTGIFGLALLYAGFAG